MEWTERLREEFGNYIEEVLTPMISEWEIVYPYNLKEGSFLYIPDGELYYDIQDLI